MSYLNSFTYVPTEPVFDCEDGIYDLCIKNVEDTTSRSGSSMLVITCNVRSQDGKVLPVPYKLFISEGPYFDRTYSRFLDCFGLPYTQSPMSFTNALGRAKFDHFKYNAETKKTEKVSDIQCHLITKEGFSQPVEKKSAQSPETAGTQDAPFTEDISF